MHGGNGLGGGDGAFGEAREGVEQGGDEHVTGDAAEGIQVDVSQSLLPTAEEKEERMFFFEKKNQTTFVS
jgi:hypothetical protein